MIKVYRLSKCILLYNRNFLKSSELRAKVYTIHPPLIYAYRNVEIFTKIKIMKKLCNVYNKYFNISRNYVIINIIIKYVYNNKYTLKPLNFTQTMKKVYRYTHKPFIPFLTVRPLNLYHVRDRAYIYSIIKNKTQ